MNVKKILKISLVFISSLILILVFLLNYNKDKLMAENTYTILKLTSVGATPAVIAQSSNFFPKNPSYSSIKCFKLENNAFYKIKLSDKNFIKEGTTINYKRYGNFVFNREELEIADARDDIGGTKALETNFERLNTKLDELESQIGDIESQLWDIQMGH